MTDDQELLPNIVRVKAEARRHYRNPVLLKAKIYQLGILYDCVVRDISPGGAKIIKDVMIGNRVETLQIGAALTLSVERFGDFPGRVIWYDEKYIGLQFLEVSEEIRDVFLRLLPEVKPARRRDD